MSRENPLRGAPRIQAELALLGQDGAESTVAKYMFRRRSGPPSQTWQSLAALAASGKYVPCPEAEPPDVIESVATAAPRQIQPDSHLSTGASNRPRRSQMDFSARTGMAGIRALL